MALEDFIDESLSIAYRLISYNSEDSIEFV